MKKVYITFAAMALAMTSMQANTVTNEHQLYANKTVAKASTYNDDGQKAKSKKVGQNVTTGLTQKPSYITLSYNSIVVLWKDAIIAPSIICTENYDGKLIYESSNENVLVVDEETGALTPMGPGTATITINGGETRQFKAPEPVSYTVTIVLRKNDLNQDGQVDVADVMTIIEDIAKKTNHDTDATGSIQQGVAAVDLGLPSGTLWANMNIGATTPEGYGLYFAWGETTGYTSNDQDGRVFDIPSYKWIAEGQSADNYYNKYQIEDGYTECSWYNADGQFIGDGKDVLDPEDDAAAVIWGGNWCMPTADDIVELLQYTTSEWTILNEVYGCKFTSPTNGNFIFLPAAGARFLQNLTDENKDCEIWTKSINPYSSRDAVHMNLSPSLSTWGFSVRYAGKNIRPVQKKQ